MQALVLLAAARGKHGRRAMGFGVEEARQAGSRSCSGWSGERIGEEQWGALVGGWRKTRRRDPEGIWWSGGGDEMDGTTCLKFRVCQK